MRRYFARASVVPAPAPSPGRPSGSLIRRVFGATSPLAREGDCMDGKAKYIFPVVITAIIVFVVSGVVTWHNIGFRFDFVRRWLSAFVVGWPVAAVTAYSRSHSSRRATARLVAPHRRQRADALGARSRPPGRSRRAQPRLRRSICARQAIAAREGEIGAFVVLDIDGARRRAQRIATRSRRRCAGCRSASRTSSTPPIFPTEYGSADLPRPSAGERTPSWCRWCAAPADSCSARP